MKKSINFFASYCCPYCEHERLVSVPDLGYIAYLLKKEEKSFENLEDLDDFDKYEHLWKEFVKQHFNTDKER